MNIGIDFDNTIAQYVTSFGEVALEEGIIDGNWECKGKTELRDHLRHQPNGEKIWMKLQGLVYGKYMHRAEMLPGVANFLMSCKRRNHNLFIVSHKTEYGHFDPGRISLRQEALKWMEAKQFFDSDEHFNEVFEQAGWTDEEMRIFDCGFVKGLQNALSKLQEYGEQE